MRLIKKYLYSGPLNPVTIEDYLNYWRDNNVETDEALMQRLAEKYGSNHMLNWIALRQYEINNPQSVHTGTGVIIPTPKKSMSNKLADSFEDIATSNTLEGGLARTLGTATLGGVALANLPTTIGGLVGGKIVDTVTSGFGELLENLTGIDSRVADFFNPGYLIGGYLGNKAINLVNTLGSSSKAAITIPSTLWKYNKLVDYLNKTFKDVDSVLGLIEAFNNKPILERLAISKELLNKYNFDIYKANPYWKVYKDEVKPSRAWEEYFSMGIPPKQVTDSPNVAAFYSTIIKPALDKSTKAPPEIDNLFKSFNIQERYTSPGASGITTKDGSARVLDQNNLFTLTHEIHHLLRNLLLKRNKLLASTEFGYYTPEEQAILNYFPYKDINEVGASLAESKFAIFMDLKTKLNRYPTLLEFESFIKNMDIDRLLHYFNKGAYSHYINKNLKTSLEDKINKAIETGIYPTELKLFNEYPNIGKYNSPEDMRFIIEGDYTKLQAERIRKALLKLGIGTGIISVGTAN